MTITEARERLENKIRTEHGGKMHTVSRIKIHELNGKQYLELDDVLELCRQEKKKIEAHNEKGYLYADDKEVFAASNAVNHLQLLFISDELSKADNIDDHKAIIEKHARSRVFTQS